MSTLPLSFFPTTPRPVDSHNTAPVRIVEVMWVGLGAGSPRGWDFMNEALRCEMVEFFRNVDSKFVGVVAGEEGNCLRLFWPS